MENDRVMHQSAGILEDSFGKEELESCLKMLPLGGWTSYAEKIRDIRTDYDRSLRKRPNSDEEIRVAIANRIDKRVDIVDLRLSHSEYLTVQCLDKLVDKKAEQEFFVAAQKVKRQLLKSPIQKGLSHEEITKRISKAVLAMRTDYRQTRKIDGKNYRKIGNDDWDINSFIEPKLKVSKPLRYLTPPNETLQKPSIRLSDMTNKIDAARRKISSLMNPSESELTFFAEELRNTIHALCRLFCQISQEKPQKGGKTHE